MLRSNRPIQFTPSPRSNVLIAILIAQSVALMPNARAEDEVEIVTWNVESGGADISAIADRVARMRGVDLWGFTEVADAEWMNALTTAAEAGEPGSFEHLAGTTGGGDLLAIVYDTEEFRLIEHFEMHWTDAPWYRAAMRPRSPLIAKFEHIESGVEFYFAVSHLYRGQGVDERRLAQAKALSAWASGATLPVIAVGDFNFDWDLDPEDAGKNYDKGYGHMTGWSVFHWVVPANLITTHDSYYNSILDFVFVANAAGRLNARSRILAVENEFSPAETKPDHRPVLAHVRFRQN